MTCTCSTFCSEDEPGCDECREMDTYLPCPTFGYGCGYGAKPGQEKCDCCTIEQWKRARSA